VLFDESVDDVLDERLSSSKTGSRLLFWLHALTSALSDSGY
jgi:hypothetical protein